jgi:hypothetical protein
MASEQSPMMVFTFEDPETHERLSIVAPKEAAARLCLGNHWRQRPLAFAPSKYTELGVLIQTALAEERAAFVTMQVLDPIVRVRTTIADIRLQRSAQKAKWQKLREWRQALERINAGF